jgi:SAM-dependent methyltransferase
MRPAGDRDELHGSFDAMIGRRVLCYIPDPANAIRAALRRLRAGGVVAFAEVDWTIWSSNSYPRSSYFEQVWRWIYRAFEVRGTDMAMGTKLYGTFVEAGLPPPVMVAAAGIGAASTLPHVLGLLRSTRQTILAERIATPEELDLDLIAQRFSEELDSNGRVFTGGFEVFGWSRIPLEPPAS